jgi:hypothetical protein
VIALASLLNRDQEVVIDYDIKQNRVPNGQLEGERHHCTEHSQEYTKQA